MPLSRTQWESSNARLHARLNEVTAEVKRRADSFQAQCVDGVNGVLDYIEFALENYTLPPSDGETANKLLGDKTPRVGVGESKLC